jgi:uncharacterized damage-inducible protein DinB
LPSSNPTAADPGLLEALLDSWDRSNTILVGLLRAVPSGGLAVRATKDGPSVAQLFTHMHSVRLAFVSEDAPEFCAPGDVPSEEWVDVPDPEQIAAQLSDSARTVREAVRGRLESGRAMEQHYDHPILMLQHMLWHEGYHHGQIKLALKLTGQPIPDKVAGPVTWGVWMRKTAGRPS